MRIKHGEVKRVNEAQKVHVRSCRFTRHRNYWLGVWLVVIATCGLTGCQHLKTGAATAGLVAASSALGVATVPTALIGGTGAAVVSALTAEPTVQAAEITADTVVSEAPDNLWSVVQRLVELGGIGLILAFVIVPLLAGWLIPGPTKLNRREKG
jgi:hypothetical protein